jgi:hypothetical protein
VRPSSNTVVVGRRDEVAQSTFSVDGARFTAGEPPRERFAASVRIRHRAPDVPAEVTMVGRDRFVVETASPVWAPAPGQAAVLYDGDECLGGGRIARAGDRAREMTLGPWLIWVPLLALINLLVFLTIRGRWGRSALALAVASVVGVVLGDQVAARTGLEVLRIGDMHVLAASVMAQVLMVAVALLGALGPIRVED